jgi:hypothetical protein
VPRFGLWSVGDGVVALGVSLELVGHRSFGQEATRFRSASRG